MNSRTANVQMRPPLTCYACDAPSEGEEHFPPKAFIPTALQRGFFRTLPACRRHNQDRSRDDQYVASVVGIVSPTIWRDPEYVRRLHRGLHRISFRGGQVATTGTLAQLIREGNRPIPGGRLPTLDRARAQRVFGDMAAAAYFVETRRKALGNATVRPRLIGVEPHENSFSFADPHDDDLSERIRTALIERVSADEPHEHEVTFLYRVASAGAVYLRFHACVDVVVYWPWLDAAALLP